MPQSSPVPGLSVIRVLGHGGYSTVYRAVQKSVGREVALKIDHRRLLSEADEQRFYREVHAAGQVSGHPHVIDVHDAGVTSDGRPYLVMELCPAGSFADRLHDEGPVPFGEVIAVGIAIADALATAHRLGIMHRDVKPANILIDRYGQPELADFGLAARFDPDAAGDDSEAMTPAFAAPETFRRSRPTPAVDVYGLASTLYALLTGRPPRWPQHRTPDLVEIEELTYLPVPDIPGMPPALTQVLRVGMAVDPAGRHTAGVLRDALRALVADGIPPGEYADPSARGVLDVIAHLPTARLPGRHQPPT